MDELDTPGQYSHMSAHILPLQGALWKAGCGYK